MTTTQFCQPTDQSDRVAHTTRPLLILGATDYALELADVIDDVPDLHVAGFVENMRPECGDEDHGGYPIYWIDDIGQFAGTHTAVCALATTHRRRFVEQAEAHGIEFATVVHPTATVSKRATLAPGVIVGARCVVAAYAQLGRHVRLNRGAIIGHHTKIDDFGTIQPAANIGGCCHLGQATYVGMSAVIIDSLQIGSQSVVGAGAVVTKNVPDRVQVIGVPARISKQDIDGK